MNETPRRVDEEYQALLTKQAEKVAGMLPTDDPVIMGVAKTIADLCVKAEIDKLGLGFDDLRDRYRQRGSGC